MASESPIEGIGYDALFEQLERDRVWGVVSFRLKEGKPVQIKMETSYLSVQDAIRRKSYDTEAIPELPIVVTDPVSR